MVVAANDVSNAHIVIVDHNRVHVGWIAIGTQDDEVIEIGIGKCHVPLNNIGDNGGAITWCFDPDGRSHTFRSVCRIAVAPPSIVERASALSASLFAHLFQFLGGGIATIGLAEPDQFFCDLAVSVGAGILRNRIAVPGQSQPTQAVENGLHCFGRVATPIRVLDAQQHLATTVLGIEPVEERRPGSADVEKSGRGGGERTSDGVSGHGWPQQREYCRLEASDNPELRWRVMEHQAFFINPGGQKVL